MSKAITRSKGEGDLRELVDRLETENRMLRTHNIYLKTQLNNSRSELETLRLLFRELNELGLGALLQVLEGFQFPQETQPRDWNADAVVYPQAIFPTELWELIWMNVPDSQTILNCCQVFPWLHTQLYSGKEHYWGFDKVFPNLLKYLPKKDVLNCRLVCNRWRNSIDGFLESRGDTNADPGQYWLQLDTLKPLLQRKELLHSLFSHNKIAGPLSTYFRSYRNKNHNPIIGRAVQFPLNGCRSLPMLCFLSDFGHQIWHLEITFKEETAYRLMQRVWQVLSFVSNMRTFTIHNTMGIHQLSPDEENIAIKTGAEFRSYVRRLSPLPSLPNLTALISHLFGESSSNVNEALVAAYRTQLECVSIFEPMQMFLPDMPHLRELTLYMNADQHLIYLASVWSPLTKLTLHLSYNSIAGFGRVFEVLERFDGSLKHLTLVLPDWYRNHRRSNSFGCELQLRLPSLKKLVVVDGGQLSFNFLTGVTHLEHLELITTKTIRSLRNFKYEIVGIHKYRSTVNNDEAFMTFYKSNIWQRLKLLKVFRWKPYRYSENNRCYTRESWEYYWKMKWQANAEKHLRQFSRRDEQGN